MSKLAFYLFAIISLLGSLSCLGFDAKNSQSNVEIKHPVNPKKHPWHVAISFIDTDSNPQQDQNNVYGGTVIGKKWILTAASIFKYEFYLFEAWQQATTSFIIQTGVSDRTAPTEDYQQTVNVEKIICNKEFLVYGSDWAGQYFATEPFYPRYYNDICLLKLETELEFNEYTFPVNLPHKQKNLPRIGSIAGFGQNLNFAADYLTSVKLPILSNEDCIEAFQNYSSDYLGAYDFNPKSQLCAGLNDEQNSFCNNDIGGGLIVKKGDKHFIVGIASLPTIIYGNDWCNGQNYGTNNTAIFTKVSHFYHWIHDKIGDNK